jgi:NADH-quinone oxidoreductase subunit M
VSWTPMLILILVFGVFPNLLFRIFDPPVTDLVARLTEALGR